MCRYVCVDIESKCSPGYQERSLSRLAQYPSTSLYLEIHVTKSLLNSGSKYYIKNRNTEM